MTFLISRKVSNPRAERRVFISTPTGRRTSLREIVSNPSSPTQTEDLQLLLALSHVLNTCAPSPSSVDKEKLGRPEEALSSHPSLQSPRTMETVRVDQDSASQDSRGMPKAPKRACSSSRSSMTLDLKGQTCTGLEFGGAIREESGHGSVDKAINGHRHQRRSSRRNARLGLLLTGCFR
jgi:hypothetical protein